MICLTAGSCSCNHPLVMDRHMKLDDRNLLAIHDIIVGMKRLILDQLRHSMTHSLLEFQRAIQADIPHLNDCGKFVVDGKDTDLECIGNNAWTPMLVTTPSESDILSLRQRSVKPWRNLTAELLRMTLASLEEKVSKSLHDDANRDETNMITVCGLLRSFVVSRYLQSLKETGETVALESYQSEYDAPFTMNRDRFNLLYTKEQSQLSRIGTLSQDVKNIIAVLAPQWKS